VSACPEKEPSSLVPSFTTISFDMQQGKHPNVHTKSPHGFPQIEVALGSREAAARSYLH